MGFSLLPGWPRGIGLVRVLRCVFDRALDFAASLTRFVTSSMSLRNKMTSIGLAITVITIKNWREKSSLLKLEIMPEDASASSARAVEKNRQIIKGK